MTGNKGEFTLLTKEEIEKLDATKRDAKVTDFAICNWCRPYKYYTKSCDQTSNKVICRNMIVNEFESMQPNDGFGLGIRLAYKSKKPPELFMPQNITSEELREKIEEEFNANGLAKTTNEWPFREGYLGSGKKYPGYIYKGKEYIRYQNADGGENEELSNGFKYKGYEYLWIEVSKIEWLRVPGTDLFVTESVIDHFRWFDNKKTYNGKFEDTLIKKYIDEKLVPSMIDKSKLAQPAIKSSASTPAVTANNATNTQATMPSSAKTPAVTANNATNTQAAMSSSEKKTVIQKETNDTKRKNRKTKLQKLNPDTTEESQMQKMTDTELIKYWVDSGDSVLLRGPSGIGKTERIRNLYPNLIELKLTNNMFPEKVIGSMNIQTGEEIPPNYAKQIVMQGTTEEEKKQINENIQNIYDIADEVYRRSQESDEKQVLLLDELLNVNEHIQSLVYTLVLSRLIEIGKGMKLPKNVVIVGTGNQKKYSRSAYELVEPLEKRFDHILDMEPKVGEWLLEYAIPKKVHPAVIGYIMSKYNSKGRSENIEDIGYFYEEPEIGTKTLDKYGQKGRTNDPRGWVSISKSLYNFERCLQEGKFRGKDITDILKRTIKSKLREEWADEFFDFYNMPTLTPAEIVSKKFTEEDLPEDINERFAYVTALLMADENQVEACRDFIRQYCDPEYLSIYDMCWVGNDERRMEKLAEIQELSKGHSAQEASKFASKGLKAYKNLGKAFRKDLPKDKSDRERE